MKLLKNIIGLMILGLSLSFTIPLFAQNTHNQEITIHPKHVQRFGIAVEQIKRLYVKAVKDEKLFSEAIRGMLSGLDPHSTYLDEKAFKSIKERTKGSFVGLGVEIVQEKGIVKVISPIDDTPAQKAGIRAGDYILAIDNAPLIDVPLNEVINKMRGPKGSKIILTVVNEKDKQRRNITIIRNVIHIKSVKYELLGDGFGYIRVSHFQEPTTKKIKYAIRKLQEKTQNNLHGLIIDLRNNPGGLLDASRDVTDLFLDSKTLGKNKFIVYTKGRIPSAKMSMEATPGDITYGTPLIVLINSGSASASEIVAGALQDHKRAIVLGERSFGKGSVQTILPIDEKTGVKLTTALYYTPKGRSIQAEGIKPDILVEDLKLKREKEDALFIWKLREKDLNGALKNGNTKQSQPKSTDKKTLSKTVMTKLATNDYQLYEAVKLLKTMHLLEKRDDG